MCWPRQASWLAVNEWTNEREARGLELTDACVYGSGSGCGSGSGSRCESIALLQQLLGLLMLSLSAMMLLLLLLLVYASTVSLYRK